MAGKGLVALFAATCAAATVLGTAAGAGVPGTPPASSMALTAKDFPGAKTASQGTLSIAGDPNLIGAYQRDLKFGSPYGASRYLFLNTEVLLASSVDTAAAEYHNDGHEFSTAKGQAELVKLSVGEVGAKNVKSVSRIKARPLGFGDSALEIGAIVHTKGGVSIDVSLSLYRVGKVVVLDFAIGGGSKINAADARAFGKVGVAHIDAALVPIAISAPTITGAAVQGQTLMASSGTWGDEPASYAYQWQHCDATGANCTAVADATASTYAVTAADVGFTLRVAVTATNRFGSVASPASAQTAVAA
jgi:hypothetical protein